MIEPRFPIQLTILSRGAVDPHCDAHCVGNLMRLRKGSAGAGGKHPKIKSRFHGRLDGFGERFFVGDRVCAPSWHRASDVVLRSRLGHGALKDLEEKCRVLVEESLRLVKRSKICHMWHMTYPGLPLVNGRCTTLAIFHFLSFDCRWLILTVEGQGDLPLLVYPS
jgi:hypothetical protein